MISRLNINRFILVISIFALCAPCLATAGDVPSDELKKAARDGLNNYFKYHKLDNGFRNRGFDNQADLDNAELGEGFRIYFIYPDKFLDSSAPQDLQTLAAPTNDWRFLVVSGGKARTLLKLDLHRGQWDSNEMERSPLAKEINGIMAVWPASAGYSYRYISALAATAEFMELSKEGKVVGVIPLSELMAKTGRTAGDIKPGDLRDPQEFLKKLRLRFKANNEPFSSPPDEVMTAARDALKNSVKGYKIEDQRMFGFESQADIDNAELGEGYQEFYMDTKKLLDESSPLDFPSLTHPSNIWHFPVVANGRTVSSISVLFKNGLWSTYTVGNAGLARELSGLKAGWPASSSYQFRYVVTRGVGTQFIELSQRGKVLGVFHLFDVFRAPGRTMGEFKPEYLRDPQEVLGGLRLNIKQNRERNKLNLEPQIKMDKK